MQRLKRGAELAGAVPAQRSAVRSAISTFEKAVPELERFRNVGEHIDAYALGQGFDASVKWRSLQVGGWDGTTFEWLDTKLDAEAALKAGRELVGEVEWARIRVLYPEKFSGST